MSKGNYRCGRLDEIYITMPRSVWYLRPGRFTVEPHWTGYGIKVNGVELNVDGVGRERILALIEKIKQGRKEAEDCRDIGIIKSIINNLGL